MLVLVVGMIIMMCGMMFAVPMGMEWVMIDAGRELLSFCPLVKPLCATPDMKRRKFINKLGNISSPSNGAVLTMS